MKNIVNLGNVATYINGYAFKPSDWAEDGTPIIRIQDLTGNSYQMNRFKGIVDSKYDVNSGDVLISWSASLGVYVWNRGNAVLNQHIFKVVFDKEEVDKDFFVFQIDNLLKRAANQAHGATMRHLTKPVFDALPFYLPDIKTQRLISSKLNLIVHLIEDHHEQLKKLDELIRSRFIEMFGKPSELNNFANAQIKDVASVGVGIVIKPTRFYSNDKSGKRAFRSLNIGPFGVSPNSEWVYFTNEAMAENKRTIVHEGDVLIVRSGNPGTCCVVPKEYDGCNVIDLIIAHPNKRKILPEYLCAFTNMPHGMNQVNNQKHGVAQRHFNVSMYEKMKIYVPNLSLQQQYVNFMMQVDKSKYREAIFLYLLEDIRICCNI